ncbi:MAG TPA: hypothetical protein VMW83_16330 [Spirochaetia bacterium]|nr:hypothetical protein [Spirochaetia bacterium]
MLTDIELTGLSRETFPLGAMAALGVLNAVSPRDDLDTGDWLKNVASLPTLRWGGSPSWRPVLSFTGTAEDLLDSLVEHFERTRESFLNSPFLVDCAKVDVSFVHAVRNIAREASLGQRELLDIVAGMTSTTVTTKKSKDGQERTTAGVTFFDMTSGQQTIIGGLQRIASFVDRERFREAVFGPWQYVSNGEGTLHHLGLDPTRVSLGAHSGIPPTDQVSSCVPGAVWLATVSWSLFPCVPRNRSTSVIGWTLSGERQLRWPVWEKPLSLAAVKLLLAQPPTADLDGFGVASWFRASRKKVGGEAGNYQALSFAEEL